MRRRLICRSMCCAPAGGTFVADAPSRRDPTGTSGVRSAMRREGARRVRKVLALVRHAILDLDVLGMKGPTVTAQLFRRVYAGGSGAPPATGAFASEAIADRVHGFVEWFDDTAREVLIGVPKRQRPSKDTWYWPFVERAFKRGQEVARRSVVTRDAPSKKRILRGGFGPTSDERVQILAGRVYTDLEGVSDEMSKRLARVLSDGVNRGEHPRDIAREIAEELDFSYSRANVIAQTELIGAHAEGSLDEYEQAGVEGVKVLAEFTTAGDDVVCPECEDLEGTEYTLEEARGVIPVHPNCRCAWIPVVADEE